MSHECMHGELRHTYTRIFNTLSHANSFRTCVYSMAASFGSGVVYSLVTGSPNPLQSALSTGMAFAVFNGLFYQVCAASSGGCFTGCCLCLNWPHARAYAAITTASLSQTSSQLLGAGEPDVQAYHH